MVGHMTLDHGIGVRIPASQPLQSIPSVLKNGGSDLDIEHFEYVQCQGLTLMHYLPAPGSNAVSMILPSDLYLRILSFRI